MNERLSENEVSAALPPYPKQPSGIQPWPGWSSPSMTPAFRNVSVGSKKFQIQWKGIIDLFSFCAGLQEDQKVLSTTKVSRHRDLSPTSESFQTVSDPIGSG